MKRLGLNIVAATLCFTAGLLAAASWGFVSQREGVGFRPAETAQVTVPARKLPERRTALPESPIRRVDFLNFTYPNDRGRRYPLAARTFTLVDGEFDYFEHGWVVSGSLSNILYSDLTGDGEEEAVVRLLSQTSSSGGEHFFYIYTMERGRPKLLRSFGTHASGTDVGGVRDVFVESGDLVLNLYGRNEMKGDNSGFTLSDDCDDCLKVFTRVRLGWDGKRFRQKGKLEVLPLRGRID